MEFSVRLVPGSQSPARARQVVDETFGRWGCDDLTDDARLVVSELVTNAVVHAKTELELVLELRPNELRIRVTDQGAGSRIAPSEAGASDTGGRGLHLVDALADRWGIEHRVERAPGTTVWAAWQLPRRARTGTSAVVGREEARQSGDLEDLADRIGEAAEHDPPFGPSLAQRVARRDEHSEA